MRASPAILSRHRRSRRALSLLELLLVVALLGVLVLTTVPRLEGFSLSQQLPEAVKRQRAIIAMARAEAMNSGHRYQMLFRRDGEIEVRRQVDPIDAPDMFVPVREPWATYAGVFQDVWVDEFIELPDGPPPLESDEDDEVYEEWDDEEVLAEPTPIIELLDPLIVEFTPTGTSNSLRWTLRNTRGIGVELTLDGRLGRLHVNEQIASLDESEVFRPDPIPEDELEEERELLIDFEREFMADDENPGWG